MDAEMSDQEELTAFIAKWKGMSPRERQACYDELLADNAKLSVELAIVQDQNAAQIDKDRVQTDDVLAQISNMFAENPYIRKVEVGPDGEYEYLFCEAEIVAMQEIQEAAVLDQTIIVSLRETLQDQINTAYETYYELCYTVDESGRTIQRNSEIFKKLGRAMTVAKERVDKLVADGERKPLL